MEPIEEEDPYPASELVSQTARAAEVLHKADLVPPVEVPCLSDVPTTDFQSSLPEHANAARALLVQHRVSNPMYRTPEKQKRDFFRTEKKKKIARDEASWTFTKHEVACTFDQVLSREPLEPVGVAQALLGHAEVSCLDELWAHLHDSKLEKRMKSRFRRSRASLAPDSPWLNSVTEGENVDYAHLMCQAGVDQELLDGAFAVALGRHSMTMMTLLLSFGACASGCQDQIRELFQHDDIAVATLLLSARPCAMSVEAWRYCLAEQVAQQPPSLLLLCLANRPAIVCDSLLLNALKLQNLQASAALLAYASHESGLAGVAHLACGLASHVADMQRRLDYFTLLADAGLVIDGDATRAELMADVMLRHFPLLRLLVHAGVALDAEPHNALAVAVSSMDFDLLDCFRGGEYRHPVALALHFVPDSTPEPQLLQLVDILAPAGLNGEPVDSFLVRAAHEQHVELAKKLLSIGASVEYQAGHAIRASIGNADFDMLSTLLIAPCSPVALSATLPTAMTLQPRSSRHRTVKALVEKGIPKLDLGVPLQFLVFEAGDIDSTLVQLLLQYGAPIEGIGDDTTDAILQTARRCDLTVMSMLCNAEPWSKMISKAIPVAYEARCTCGYDAALQMIRLLLLRGATGIPVHETLQAATLETHRLEMVRTLIEHGADANYANGAAFSIALEVKSHSLLEILCQGCPPSHATTEHVLYIAVHPQYYNPLALELLLSSTQSAGAALDAAWDSAKLHGNPNLNTIVPCLLRHGLNVDLRDGAVLCFAVQEMDINLLECMLSSGPSIGSLTAAFAIAASIESRQFRFKFMSMFLVKAHSVEIGQSRELLQQTHLAFSGDFAGLALLFRHNAKIDFNDGEAVLAAAEEGNIEVLDYLLAHQPAIATLHRACLAAAASSTLTSNRKRLIFVSILDARDREMTEADNMSQLLSNSVANLPNHTQLPLLLIEQGVKINYETLKTAVQTSTCDLFKALMDAQDTNTITKIFRGIWETPIDPERKYWIYEVLLKLRVATGEVSIALVDSLQACQSGNLEIPKLLLEHGAAVAYKSCAAFSLALRANSLVAVQLLSQYLLDDLTACVAFDLAREATKLSANVRIGVYSCLLEWNISAPSVYSALVRNFESGHVHEEIVHLLLHKGADPNQESARCFIMAAIAGLEPVFRLLSKYANIAVVLWALISHFKAEWEVLLWFTTCLEEQHHLANIDDQDLLYECMRKFPASSGLLKVLLERGVSPAVPIQTSLAIDWKLEQCTPLIWAICTKVKIGNDPILALLEYGGHEALPMYSTTETGVTAAFACLLDKTRKPVLDALLDLDREGTLQCNTPASTFRRLGAGRKVGEQENEDGLPPELPLRSACIMLGNMDAYDSLRCEEMPNDGTLHVAAFMALPKFVAWLLDFHDPNAKVLEEFDQMVPLALACSPRKVPWCKIADEEADLVTRRNQCIMLLGSVTNLVWRYGQKTVIHIALENGPEVTKVMLEALKVRRDSKRDDSYLYQDKEGIHYSPEQYVVKKMPELSNDEKTALIKSLRENKFQSRYFRSALPGEGTQPVGYHGLPSGLAKAWKAHEQGLPY